MRRAGVARRTGLHVALLALGLPVLARAAPGLEAQGLVVTVDDRPEFPFVVAAAAGSSCGNIAIARAARPVTHAALVAALTPAPTATSTPDASVLPLVPTPSLLGAEGLAIVMLAERAQARLGVSGPIALELDARGARLKWQVPVGSVIDVDADLDDVVAAAVASRGAADAEVGTRAIQAAHARSCFGSTAGIDVVDARTLRARFRVAAIQLSAS